MATDKFVFCAMLLPGATAISGKASNSKRPSQFMRSSLQLGASCVFRRTAQPSAMCGALYARAKRSRIARPRRDALAHAGVRCMNGESPCCAGRRGRNHPPLGPTATLTAIAFAYATASALLTDCNSLPMPRFRQTCGRKYGMPCGGRSASATY